MKYTNLLNGPLAATVITKSPIGVGRKKKTPTDKKEQHSPVEEKPNKNFSKFKKTPEQLEKLAEEFNMSDSLEDTDEDVLNDEEDDSDKVLSDRFKLITKSVSLTRCFELVAEVHLPKIVFQPSMKKQNSSRANKSPLSVFIFGGVNREEKINPYLDLLKASRDGLENLEVHLLDKNDESIMTLSLLNPRIAAIDFGDLAAERKEFRQIKIEFEYDLIEINGETL